MQKNFTWLIAVAQTGFILGILTCLRHWLLPFDTFSILAHAIHHHALLFTVIGAGLTFVSWLIWTLIIGSIYYLIRTKMRQRGI
ncbi:hypothetical protein [Periweissella ghanensis]|uniref:Uncharacterized protein n=1 Tax=Periweissella ghanensis TaxID=467997 RepID=A0ABN8BN61_9LACO|nr:hypothetical protein [Periweissella ghanensis]MCM0600447.1 hypothetical protein [Periweissella ghanensis]CAH0418089.1 hypothetical protein WGH24286_00505 [Periweissella ghanensis]